MRIPNAESDIGIVERCYDKNTYIFTNTEKSWFKNCGHKYCKGRRMTWAEFKEFAPKIGRYGDHERRIRPNDDTPNYK